MKFGRWDQTQVAFFTPTLASGDQPFANSLQFPKKDLFGEHNPSMTALFKYFLSRMGVIFFFYTAFTKNNRGGGGFHLIRNVMVFVALRSIPAPPGWLSGECVGLMISAEACEKST